MTNLRELSLSQLAAKLRHTIARNTEESQQERVELENVNQWISLRQQQEQIANSEDSNQR